MDNLIENSACYIVSIISKNIKTNDVINVYFLLRHEKLVS